MSTELENAIQAIRNVNTQADLNVLADVWKQQMNYIGKMAGRGITKGDTIQWEYRGVVKTGTVTKVNPKTVEVANAGASPFGRTITKIYKSMITGKLAA